MSKSNIGRVFRKKNKYLRPRYWGSGLVLAGLTVAAGLGAFTPTYAPAEEADITVYKSSTCGCCAKWVNHLKDNGFSVEVRNRKNLQPIKDEYGIEKEYQSCHTAVIDGYVVEGHVPVTDIKRMLTERPDIKGLAVPGMPMGSPGMEGPRKDKYSVLSLDKTGTTAVYNRY